MNSGSRPSGRVRDCPHASAPAASRFTTPAEPTPTRFAVEPDSLQPAQSREEAATATEPAPAAGADGDGATAGDGAPLSSAAQPASFAAATLDELRKVVWPSRQQLFSESVAVILMVGLSAAAIAAIDRFFGWAASQVFS